MRYRFEIVVTLTGSSRTTGQVSQSRTSYLPSEIVWGRRFVNMSYYDELSEMYVADFDRMDHTETADMSGYSAKQLVQIQNVCNELLNRRLDDVIELHPNIQLPIN